MGSCTAEATIDCQLNCQTEQYVECEEEMVETCETECETTGGAIFCDGQFLAVEDIDECAEELSAEIDIHVEVDIEVDAEVDVDIGGGDDDGDDDVDCSIADVRKSDSGSGSWLSALGMLAFAGVLHRRNFKRSRASK